MFKTLYKLLDQFPHLKVRLLRETCKGEAEAEAKRKAGTDLTRTIYHIPLTLIHPPVVEISDDPMSEDTIEISSSEGCGPYVYRVSGVADSFMQGMEISTSHVADSGTTNSDEDVQPAGPLTPDELRETIFACPLVSSVVPLSSLAEGEFYSRYPSGALDVHAVDSRDEVEEALDTDQDNLNALNKL